MAVSTDAPLLRRDAAANRERIVAAARELLAREGLEASMEEVARAAGVGAGTLYRRFVTKDVLIDAILEDVLGHYHALAQRAVEHEDAFTGLQALLEGAAALQLQNRAFIEVWPCGCATSPSSPLHARASSR